ncbi:hypothetical protein [Pantoea cypripedii]|uniref:Uncharacterized protein n=1 Tax=Pantoea cypripedii TaxID=55209 RepID=A0A1X1EFX7_PANCY|nr:hypothetical protein [Pantoea cypripedii]MBP2199878.1 hypothetical protein [Pantoea cypripedii]ORM87858.1 hypothetical protein HA50_28385 [Pantoea cypripedii]
MPINNTQSSIYVPCSNGIENNLSVKLNKENGLEVDGAFNTAEAKFKDDMPKILVVGYSPTGGGHTARTLNIVEEALNSGSLPEGSLVFIHVPPVWEGTPRPQLLNALADKLLAKGVQVKFAESDKPVYGYLDAKTGGSDDPEILKRIALHPLRNDDQSGKNQFLKKYFSAGDKVKSAEHVENHTTGGKVENLKRISANDLMKSYAGNKNLHVLSDMDPALQKASYNTGVPSSKRVDQQNHAILLDPTNKNNNQLSKSVLAKVLDARGGQISHIALGGKNTLREVLRAANKLGIDDKTSLKGGKAAINKVLFSAAKHPDTKVQDIVKGSVLIGQGVKAPDDINKVVYVYAHKKMPIIAEHIKQGINAGEKDYNDKAFVFCGKDATPGHNAMHLAYLADADGMTTSGAGTCGEFAYLHREAGAQSNLLILPIEGHNEQEAIADSLCQEFPNNMLRLSPGEKLEQGTKIDQLVARKQNTKNDSTKSYHDVIKAISQESTYVNQAHDILFGVNDMAGQDKIYQTIERGMYNDPDMKATRHYLKLYFQLESYLSQDVVQYPISIKFKEAGAPGVTFKNFNEVKDLLKDDGQLKNLLGMSDKVKVKELPMLEELRGLVTSTDSTSLSEKFKDLNVKMGHHMVTGF